MPPSARGSSPRNASGDAALQAEVLSLLDAHARAGSFVEHHAVPGLAEWLATPSTAATLHAGAHVGPYEITGWLGAGGMGAVYSARDTRLGRTVAIKVLHRELRDDPAIALRFEHEARTLATLNHPNIAPSTESRTSEPPAHWSSNMSMARRSRNASHAGRSTSTMRCRSPDRSPRRWTPLTSTVSSIATSSQPT